MATIELSLKQIAQTVKRLPPKEKVLLWNQIGNGLARVTTRIRAQAEKLGLSKLSESEINQFVHQIRKQRG